MASRGLVNESCSSWLLPRLIGAGKAKELVFTGRVFRAAEAETEAPGLFNYVLPEAEVLPKALALADEIASSAGALSVALCKGLMDAGWEGTPEDAMLAESQALYHVNSVKNRDLREGIASFLEKRAPRWVHDAWEDLPGFFHIRRLARTSVRARSRL
jgi:enoyl-CoA hydratase/carnithine racemase